MRAPFQDGDFPGPVKYGYLNVGRVEGGPCAPARPRRLLPPPAPDGVRRPRRGGRAGARRRARGAAVLAGIVETAVNALWDAPPLLGDRIAVVGAGVLGCSVARLASRDPRHLGDPGRRRSVPRRRWPPRSAWTSRCRTTRRPGATSSCTPARPPRGCSGRLDLLASEGTVLELSWYGDEPTTVSLGGSFHSGRLALRASQVGRVAPARRDSRTTAQRLALALDLLRDDAVRLPADRRVALRGPARGDAAARLARAAGAVPLGHLPVRRGGGAVFGVTVRDHMMVAHSFRGEVFGPAQALHGATFVVDATFRGEGLDADGILVDIGRAAAVLRGGRRDAVLPQPRRGAGLRRHQHHHRGAGPPRRRPAGRAGRRRRPRGRPTTSTALVVTLHESHVASASYERSL